MVLATEFYQKDIGQPSNAPRHLAIVERRGNYRMLPIVFRPGRGCAWWLTIPQGFKAVVAVHGKHQGVWGPGFHFAPPWVTIPFLLSEAHFVYDTPVKECPTADNVMVTIDISLVVRVDTSPGDEGKHPGIFAFVDTLGPQQLSPQLNAFQEEAVRDMARNRRYHEIYDLMDAKHDAQLENTRRNLNNHFGEYGIEITEIAVTNVHFNNTDFVQEMAQPAIYRQQDEFNKLEQSFQLKTIKIRETETKEKQIKKEDLEKFEAGLQRNVEEITKKLNKIKADTSRELADIRETEKAEILNIKSESNLEVSKIKRERDVSIAKIKSSGKAEADAIEVETRVYVEKLKADAAVQIAKNRAVALHHLAKAENDAAKSLVQKRDYDQKFKHLRVLKGVAENRQCAITGNSGDNHIAQLLAGSQAGKVIGLNVG